MSAKCNTYVLTCCMVFILSVYKVDGGTEKEILQALDEAAAEGSWGYVPLSGPYIDTNHSQNVTAQVGSTAVLNCRILYIVGKAVSWMRSRDLHLLTVGRFTYTSDERFRAVHQSGSQEWLLKIHYLQKRDAGPYECQVSTTPPLTHTVWLRVVEPRTTVFGGPDLHINLGSFINLTCLVRFTPETQPYIFWYHDGRLLSYDEEGAEVRILTSHGEDTSSQLLIQKATARHSGLYTCTPATAPSHSINVHVINSETPAAIQHKNTTSTATNGGSSSSTSASGTQCPLISLPLLMVLAILPVLVSHLGKQNMLIEGFALLPNSMA